MRICAAFFAVPVLALGCGGHGTPETLLVSTPWLASHLKDPNLVILAVGTKEDYDAGHIPGSQFFEYKEIQYKGENGLTLELAPMPKLAEVFSRYGVGNNSRVVVYRLKDWLTQSGRVMLTLDAMGMGANASMLDGEMTVWKSEGRAVSTEAPTVKPGKLEPCAQSDVIAGLDFVKNNLHKAGVRILDARAPEYYRGETARPGLAPGHIEGAGNLHYDTLVDKSGHFKPKAEMQQMFSAAGVKAGDRVVTYCFIGQQASALYFASRYLGYDTRLYDGSWDEWTKHPELPTATGDK
jgi:thiosulfate/3-mercaptopyruvate sulfurtransferase